MLGTAPQLLMLRPHRLKRKTLYSSIHHHENLVCLTVLNESTIQNAFVIPPYSLASKLLMLKAQGNGNVDSIRFFLLPFLFYSSLWFTTSAPRNSCGRHRQGSRPALCFAEFSDTAGSHKNLHFVARLGELVTFGEFPPAASVNISPNIFLLLTILAPQWKLPLLCFCSLLMLSLHRTYFPKVAGEGGCCWRGGEEKGFIHAWTGSPCWGTCRTWAKRSNLELP